MFTVEVYIDHESSSLKSLINYKSLSMGYFLFLIPIVIL